MSKLTPEQDLAIVERIAELERELAACSRDCQTANTRIDLACDALEQAGITEYESLSDGVCRLAGERDGLRRVENELLAAQGSIDVLNQKRDAARAAPGGRRDARPLAAFIAHARTDLPDALDMLKRAAVIISALAVYYKAHGEPLLLGADADCWLEEWNGVTPKE